MIRLNGSTTDGDSRGLHQMSIQERIDWVIHRAYSQSMDFIGPKELLERTRYQADHPTVVTAFMCMDGRVNVSLLTKMPRGIIQPFRNLGGRFNLGWPHLGEVLGGSVVEETKKGQPMLCLATYHYSKSDSHRGCAGFNYDTNAARSHAFEIVRQLDKCFGGEHRSVFPIVIGIETDEEALVFHGVDGMVLDLSSSSTVDDHSLAHSLTQLYPDMPEQMAKDLLPLLKGNRSHVAEIKPIDHSSNLDHREWMICIGRGFDWLQMSNLALIIGPYSPDLADPIGKAAGIIEANMRAGRVPDDGFLVLAEAPYHGIAVDRVRAELESTFLSKFATEVIRSKFPKLAKKMHVRTAVIHSYSREVDIIKQHAA
jgi:Carboxysome Shell Carbonic Anhydrase